MPADPATLRALAARVMAGENVARHTIILAIGWECQTGSGGIREWRPSPDGVWRTGLGDFLHSLDAADQLMRPFGFNVAVTIEQYLNANWIALAYLLHANGDCERVEAIAPTEPRARTALALLCRAVEMEGEAS